MVVSAGRAGGNKDLAYVFNSKHQNLLLLTASNNIYRPHLLLIHRGVIWWSVLERRSIHHQTLAHEAARQESAATVGALLFGMWNGPA